MATSDVSNARHQVICFRLPSSPSILYRCTRTFPPPSRRALAALWGRIGDRRASSVLVVDVLAIRPISPSSPYDIEIIRRTASDVAPRDVRTVASSNRIEGEWAEMLSTCLWHRSALVKAMWGQMERGRGMWNLHVVEVIYVEESCTHLAPPFIRHLATTRFHLHVSTAGRVEIRTSKGI
ncbi:hypothetical protein SCHPADRAFT_690859 [Schizopora paradoxa]|uniref:Uncharacterized protein n=1 Tax=Schizopora paradoxa TaxID=27342 RepID=A0A0H2R521_9AGAM|nr:hypothetical protein SCHPADRAFT_690859 [Schizopora paradoxa]